MNLEIGKTYEVTVVKILPVGAVVQLEDETTELVHISNIANSYISDVADFVSVGQKYVATCEEGKNRPIQLSFIPLDLKSQRKVPPKQAPSRNIDDMLASANSHYVEKERSQMKRSKRR